MFVNNFNNMFKITHYYDRTDFGKFFVVMFTFLIITALFPLVILTLAFTPKTRFEDRWYMFLCKGIYDRDGETLGGGIGMLFGSLLSLVLLILMGIQICSMMSKVKNPMYIEYDKLGNPIELREFKYFDGYSYEYCYYTPDIFLLPYYGCWFKPDESPYTTIATKNTTMTFKDKNGNINYKRFYDMAPEDIIRNWEKPVPQKIEKQKINF